MVYLLSTMQENKMVVANTCIFLYTALKQQCCSVSLEMVSGYSFISFTSLVHSVDRSSNY